jgi:hypothetical protein
MSSIHDPILGTVESEDVLNRRALAEVVWRRLGEKDCPSAIGLYGSWGTGKTSLLNLIKHFNRTTGDALPISVYIEPIEAWCYESSGSLVVPVVTRLFSLLGKNQSKQKQVWESLQKILLTVGLTSTKIAMNTLLAQVDSSTDDISQSMEKIYGGLSSRVDTIRNTRDEFSKLVKEICDALGQQRLAIFIDDLDRCSPENVVTLLESVKNFFSVDGCVWVFAMDSGVVASYIDRKYDGTRMDGNSYLDKIIPEQYHIPSPFSYDFEGLEKLLDKVFSPLGKAPAYWKDYAKTPQVLVPRRLLKSATKFVEVNRLRNLAVGPGATDDVVFALILLYHAWPKFYQYFTIDDEKYVKGVLKYFAPADMVELFGNINLPLPEEFQKLEDLQYFLQLAFIKNKKTSEEISIEAGEIVHAMAYLRQVGLP